MEKNRLWGIDDIPLLTASDKGKHYFALDEYGHLQHFFYQNECWNLGTGNIFSHKIQGFDAALDIQGNIYLLGYDDAGSLFFLLPLAGKSSPKPFYQDSSKKICHLSSCLDKENNMHILYLAKNEEHQMWWLFYLRSEKDKWQEPVIIDFGYHYLEQKGLILRDLQDNLFILHRLFEEGKYCLVLRGLAREANRPEKTFYLQERERECFFPAFLVSPDNTLHISWLSCEDEVMFLNYTHRNLAGKWENFTSFEVPHDTLTIAPLYLVEDRLVLSWKKGEKLFYLFSLNGGKSWKRGRGKAKTGIELTRFRSVNNLFTQTKWWGDFIFASGIPPQEILYPEEFLKSRAGEGDLPEEFQILDLLSSNLLTYAGNLQTANAFLKQKLGQQEQELLKMYSWGLSRAEAMEEKLNAKKMELEKVETFFQNTLKELQERISREKEEMAERNKELIHQLKTSSQKNEELKKENLLLLKNISQLKKEVVALIKENEELRAKKKRFFPRFFSRLQG
jgi:hypothetical protein